MTGLARDLLAGGLAGAAATTALDATTYLDMALRGRPPSDVPADAASRAADRLGVDLGDPDSVAGRARRQGLGALMGYAVGIGAGMAYAVLRRRALGPPLHVVGPAAGLLVMAATDTASIASGVTDPRTWGVSGWLADIVPHLVYGVTLAAAFDQMRRQGTRPRRLLALVR